MSRGRASRCTHWGLRRATIVTHPAAAWLRQNLARFDGVVIHGLWQYHSYGTYRMVRGRTPYVVFPHGMLDPYFKRAFPLKHLKKQVYWLAREYRVLRDARAVCFTTPIERDSAAETFWPQRWNPVVVSFGTSEPGGDRATQREFSGRYPALRERRFFLFLSRIHARRDAICSWKPWRGWGRRIRSWTWSSRAPTKGGCGRNWRRRRSAWG